MTLTAYSTAVLTDAPWAFYKFDESSGSTLADSSGNGRSISLAGSPLLSQGGPGPGGEQDAIFFGDNTSQYGKGGVSTPADNNFTAGIWVYLTAYPTTNCTLFGFGDGGNGQSSNNDLSVYISSNGMVNINAYSGVNAYGGTALALNTWHFVVARASGGVSLRVDKSAYATGGGPTGSTRTVWLRGGLMHGGGAVTMGPLTIFSGSLSDARVDAHYDAMMVAPAPVPAADHGYGDNTYGDAIYATGGTDPTAPVVVGIGQVSETNSPGHLVRSIAQTSPSSTFRMYENVGFQPVTTEPGSFRMYEYITQGVGRVSEADAPQVGDPNSGPPRGLIPITNAAQVRMIGRVSETETILGHLNMAVCTRRVVETESFTGKVIVYQTSPAGAIPWYPATPKGRSAVKWNADAGVTAQVVGLTTQPAETDVARRLTVVQLAPPVNIQIGRSSETDSARALTRTGSLTVPTVRRAEIDQARSLSVVATRVLSIGRVSEVDASGHLAVTGLRTVIIGRTVETDAARGPALFQETRVLLGRVVEGDSVAALTPGLGLIAVQIGRSSETDTSSRLSVALGILSVGVSRAGELETARPLHVAAGPISSGIGSVSEQEQVAPLNIARRLDMLAEVGDTAMPLTPILGPVQVALQPVSETSTILGSLSALLRYSAPLGRLTESDSPMRLGLARPIRRVADLETASSIHVHATFTAGVGILTDVETAETLTVYSTITLDVGDLEETSSTRALGVVVDLLRQEESDALFPMAVRIEHVRRQILVNGVVRDVTFVGVWDGTRLRIAREVGWDGQNLRELVKEAE